MPFAPVPQKPRTRALKNTESNICCWMFFHERLGIRVTRCGWPDLRVRYLPFIWMNWAIESLSQFFECMRDFRHPFGLSVVDQSAQFHLLCVPLGRISQHRQICNLNFQVQASRTKTSKSPLQRPKSRPQYCLATDLWIFLRSSILD